MSSAGGPGARLLAFLGGLVSVLVLGWVVLAGPGGSVTGSGPANASAARPQPASTPMPGSTSGGHKPLSLTGPDVVHARLGTPPKAGLLFDVDSGRVLWRQAADRVLPIASTTKIMSALIVADKTDPGQTVRITREMRDFSGSAVGLPHGKRVRVESLLAAMLVQSGNDAALALATAADGNVGRFVEEMNDRARVLGLDCTHYRSPHGLEAANRSCAVDLAALARLAMRKPRIRRVVRQDGATVPWPIKGGEFNLAPTNPLLIDGYPGTLGLKTGYTEAAGQCLVGVVRRGKLTLGVVLLDSPDSGAQAEKLLDAGFRQLH